MYLNMDRNSIHAIHQHPSCDRYAEMTYFVNHPSTKSKYSILNIGSAECRCHLIIDDHERIFLRIFTSYRLCITAIKTMLSISLSSYQNIAEVMAVPLVSVRFRHIAEGQLPIEAVFTLFQAALCTSMEVTISVKYL